MSNAHGLKGRTTTTRDGASGKFLRFTPAEQEKARALEAKYSLDRLAKMLGTGDVTFERLASGAWCMRATVERVRGKMANLEDPK